MQVYALIIDGSKFLIPKKAETNDLWNGERHSSATVVNQAGQYALFGGKQEDTDPKPIDTSIR